MPRLHRCRQLPPRCLNPQRCKEDPPVSALLPAALDAAERGWPVFVLGRSKRPVANCEPCRDATDHDPAACGHLTCHGFYAATTNPDRLRRIIAAVPGGQLAVRTGTVSGLVGIDVDPGHGGDDSFRQLMD